MGNLSFLAAEREGRGIEPLLPHRREWDSALPAIVPRRALRGQAFGSISIAGIFEQVAVHLVGPDDAFFFHDR